ncbi:MAG: tRNA uridine-5-carboxymethylaminomethyl(34) synthesis GTPase MnmE [Litoreibacter sp.]
MDTIFALATAQGKAGVSIIRISGSEAFEAARIMTGAAISVGKPSLRTLKDENDALIDQALILTFDHGASFTGEKTVEFQTHGSPAIVSAVLKRLGSIQGFRPADPGEFTRRALASGNLDLAQVEGLADLIEAETEAQRLQAIRVFDGHLGNLANGWKTKLIRAAALLEATIDFVDEEVPIDVSPEVLELIDDVTRELSREERGADVAERIRDGFEVAIIGAPNIGKSTLLNRLAGRDAALTSDIAGTTRDVIEVRMDINGLPVVILDTAGIRESTSDKVEALGIDLARKRAEYADLRIFLCDDPNDDWPIEHEVSDIKLVGKGDTRSAFPNTISGETGEGVDKLLDDISKILSERARDASLIIRERHRKAIIDAQTSLNLARNHISEEFMSTEIAAEEIRGSIRALQSMIGGVGIENILDEIFASFCLGK